MSLFLIGWAVRWFRKAFIRRQQLPLCRIPALASMPESSRIPIERGVPRQFVLWVGIDEKSSFAMSWAGAGYVTDHHGRELARLCLRDAAGNLRVLGNPREIVDMLINGPVSGDPMVTEGFLIFVKPQPLEVDELLPAKKMIAWHSAMAESA